MNVKMIPIFFFLGLLTFSMGCSENSTTQPQVVEVKGQKPIRSPQIRVSGSIHKEKRQK